MRIASRDELMQEVGPSREAKDRIEEVAKTVLAALLTISAAGVLWAQTPAPAPVLLSRQLAERAHVAVGDIVTLAVDAKGTAGRAVRIVGIYEPTPDPMRFTAERLEARMHLPDFIDLTTDPHDPG